VAEDAHGAGVRSNNTLRVMARNTEAATFDLAVTTLSAERQSGESRKRIHDARSEAFATEVDRPFAVPPGKLNWIRPLDIH
jgi:hypothetical protein